ncbi:hypothetical protein EYC84_007904 [Monilinia fructicola]|uniref:Uncharacterized protein n=1 Tax=Monilinia fructicola TaxID=38448 RepID=A0A5M9JHA6_MONFR|nr:hypothetical protein EYC84_007904 [Monilinia fructicola]
MLTSLLYLSLSTLIHTLIHTFSILIFIALILVTYLLYTIRYLSNLTGLTTLLSYLWNQFPIILKRKVKSVAEERRELRHRYASERTERLRERNVVGGKEMEQMREAMRRVAWKRGVGKMEYGIDLSEDSKTKPRGGEQSEAGKNKEREIDEWIEDEVIIQDSNELREELERLEMRPDVGKKAGYWDEEEQARARDAARVLLRNGEVEAFPRFEDMDTRE